jgi:ribosomal protein L7/L12
MEYGLLTSLGQDCQNMSNKKQRKMKMDEILNPHILTLDQALRLSDENSASAETKRYNTTRAVTAVRDRVSCRFTGPSDFGRLAYGERMVWDLPYMQGEILNGGFHQYLTNSTGGTSEDVKLYLRDIGAVQTLELFKRLSKIFPNGTVPRDHKQRCAIVKEWEDLESGNDVFNELDGCFYRQSENLDALIVAYVRKHRSEFVEPSDEVVKKLKRKDRITAFCCGNAEPEWIGGAAEALGNLTEFAETKRAKLDAEKKTVITLMVKAGKRVEAVQEYRKIFSCSLAEAKAAVEELARS